MASQRSRQRRDKRAVRRLIAELKNSARTAPQHQPHSKE